MDCDFGGVFTATESRENTRLYREAFELEASQLFPFLGL